ncbi:MAG TPA: response regulator [Roseomonas sp.]|jgi:CheY-like chemotaxis protein
MTVRAGEPQAGLSGCRVLVVEDEFFIADDLMNALKEAGAEVLGPVPSRDQALNLLSLQERIDIAVLDINLQGEATYAVADALTERGIPFVLATGYGRGALPSRLEHVPHWEKPFNPQNLILALPGLARAV